MGAVDIAAAPRSFEWAWDRARRIEGWLAESQGRALFAAAAAAPPGTAIVEIGSHHGRSTVVLASACPAHARVVAVDPYDDPRWGGGDEALGILQRNLADAGPAGAVEVRRALSAQAAAAWNAMPISL